MRVQADPVDDDTDDWEPDEDGDDTQEIEVVPLTSADVEAAWWDGYNAGREGLESSPPNDMVLGDQYADGVRVGRIERASESLEGWSLAEWPSPEEK